MPLVRVDEVPEHLLVLLSQRQVPIPLPLVQQAQQATKLLCAEPGEDRVGVVVSGAKVAFALP